MGTESRWRLIAILLAGSMSYDNLREGKPVSAWLAAFVVAVAFVDIILTARRKATR